MTKKEKMFCLFYARLRNCAEAAARAGYGGRSSVMGQRLLGKKECADFIASLDEKEKAGENRNEIRAGLKRLAFGGGGDGAALAFAENVSEEEIRSLDLFNVSEIKVTRGKGVEVKFFDRLKALEKLAEITEGGPGESGLFAALAEGAKALRSSEDDG